MRLLWAAIIALVVVRPTSSVPMMRPPKFAPLPLRELRTEGWLARQLNLAAQGLAGNEHRIWPWLRPEINPLTPTPWDSGSRALCEPADECAEFSRDSQFIGRCQSKQPTHNRNMSQCEGWQFST